MGEKDDYDSENFWISDGLPSKPYSPYTTLMYKGIFSLPECFECGPQFQSTAQNTPICSAVSEVLFQKCCFRAQTHDTPPDILCSSLLQKSP